MLYMVRLRTRLVNRIRLEVIPYTSTETPHTKRVRSRTLQQLPTSQGNKKASPMSLPHTKSETNFHLVSGGDMGEVLGERGRFGG